MDMFRKKDIIAAIYREGGFSKASKKLHIAQPSLSVMVSGVEQEIGAKLFDRSVSPVRLTRVGEKYLECCDNISMIEDDFINYVNDINGLEIGEISIGGSALYISNIVPHILSEFSKRHPSIKIRLYDMDTPALIRMIQSGELDVAIDNFPSNVEKLDKHYLGTEILLLAVPQDYGINENLREFAYSYEDIIKGMHVARTRPYLENMRAFNDQPFILLQESFDTRKRCDAVFEDYGIKVRAAYELNQLQSAFGMASSGLGITIISDTLVRQSEYSAANMCYYAVRSPEFTRDVYYYTRKSRMISRDLQEFLDISHDTRLLTLRRSVSA
ncbi:MAG: LysR family transcriptional regulator [Mogibacterium sp.]|nr:LysR family transcriptional regulator [Mogibacterium sp.]